MSGAASRGGRVRSVETGHGLTKQPWWVGAAFAAACLGLVAGCSKIASNEPPDARFSVSAVEAAVGQEVALDASASTDPDGQIVAYRWEFGDGGSDEGMLVAYAYGAAGTYTVILTVEDDRGATATAERTITVAEPAGPDQPLVAAFRVNADTVAPFVEITFDASASSAWDGEIVEYRWDFGDGGEDEGEVVAYSYLDVGTYTVILTVRDNRGGVATAERTITVTEPPAGNRPPVARFTFSPLSPRVGEEVVFDASASWDDGAIVEYSWDFDDGTDAAGQGVTHVFGDPGTYVVLLVVVDNFGAEAEAEAEVVVW